MQKSTSNTHAPTKQAMKRQQIKKNNKPHQRKKEQKKDETDATKLDEDEDVKKHIINSDMEVDEDDVDEDDVDDDEEEVPLPIDSEDEAELEAQRIRFNDVVAAKAAASQLLLLSETKERSDSKSAAGTTTTTNGVNKNTSSTFASAVVSIKSENDRNTEMSNKTNSKEAMKSYVNEQLIMTTKVSQQKPLTAPKPMPRNKENANSKPAAKASGPLPQSPQAAKKKRGRPSLKRKRTQSNNSQQSSSSSEITAAAVSSTFKHSNTLERCARIYINRQQCYVFACWFCSKNYSELIGLTGHLKLTHTFFEETIEEASSKKEKKNSTLPLLPAVVIKHEPISLDRARMICCAEIFALNRKSLKLCCAKCDVKFSDGTAEFERLDEHLRAQHDIFQCPKLISKIKTEQPALMNIDLNRLSLVMVSIPSDSDHLSSEDSQPGISNGVMEIAIDKEKQQQQRQSQQSTNISREAQKTTDNADIEEILKEMNTDTKAIPKAPNDVTKELVTTMETEEATSTIAGLASKTEETLSAPKRKPRGRPKKIKENTQEHATANDLDAAGIHPTTTTVPRKRGRKPKIAANIFNTITTTTETASSSSSNEFPITSSSTTSTASAASPSQEIKQETLDEVKRESSLSASLPKSSTSALPTQVQGPKESINNESTSDTAKTPQRPMRKSKSQVIDYAAGIKDEDEENELLETNLTTTSSEYSPSSNSTDDLSAKETPEKSEKSDEELNLPEPANMLMIRKEISPDGKTVFTCNLCLKTLNKMSRMMDHQRLHTGEKPYACSICGKAFRLRVRMKEHILRHRTEKAFKCEICELPIATKQDLVLHMRHHQSDRRHKCGSCGKGFVRSSDLNIHLRIHTGEKPFNCDICGKAFRARQNLVVHRRSHGGDKPVKCEVCDKRFSRKIDLRVHMRKHTGEKPYICEICKRGYSSRFNLQSHVDREHLKGEAKKKPGRKSNSLKDKINEQEKIIEELTKRLASEGVNDLAQDDDNVKVGDDVLMIEEKPEEKKNEANIIDNVHNQNDCNGNDPASITNSSDTQELMQQVSVTVSMQVEQVSSDSTEVMIIDNAVDVENDKNDAHLAVEQPEKENKNNLVSSLVVNSPTELNEKTKAANRKITSYFTVVGQKQQAEI